MIAVVYLNLYPQLPVDESLSAPQLPILEIFKSSFYAKCVAKNSKMKQV